MQSFCYHTDRRIPAKKIYLRAGTLTGFVSVPTVAMGMTILSGSSAE
jgi:hypothetical protein